MNFNETKSRNCYSGTENDTQVHGTVIEIYVSMKHEHPLQVNKNDLKDLVYMNMKSMVTMDLLNVSPLDTVH